MKALFVLHLLSIALVCGCSPRDTAPSDRTSSDSHDSGISGVSPADPVVTAEAAVSPESAEGAHTALPARGLDAPRFRFAGSLSVLWERTSAEADTVLLAPSDIQFASPGLLVFDAGARRVRVFETSSGRLLRSFGREGRGPGELSASFWFQGSRTRPVGFDATQRRLTRFSNDGDSLETLPFPRDRRWSSTCALDDVHTLGYAASTTPTSDLLIAIGDRVIDSIPYPFKEFEAEHFMARQAIVRQLDDSSCAILTAYQSRFATIGGAFQTRLGVYAESAGPLRVNVVSSNDGKSIVSTLPRGARVGPSDARGWREYVLVLFDGRTRLAGRLLDVYSRGSLTYVGSLVLPTKARRFAVFGDSLAVLGERDYYPSMTLLLLRLDR